MGRDFYKILGLPRGAPNSHIVSAWHHLVFCFHPDNNPNDPAAAAEALKEVNHAYQVLRDPYRKEIYDRLGEEGLKAAKALAPDYYEVLGVTRRATAEEIHKAYINKVHRWHPDNNRNGEAEAGEKLQQVIIAYDVLGDAQKKRAYDLKIKEARSPFDVAGFGPSAFSSATDTNPFTKLFDPATSCVPEIPNVFGSAANEASQRFSSALKGFGVPPAHVVTVACSLEEIATGCTKKFNVTRTLPGGREDKKLFEVTVQPGWKAGTKVRFEKEGGVVQGYTGMADVVFILDEKPHPRFTRENEHLRTKAHLTLKQALLGHVAEVTTLDGRKVPVNFSGVSLPVCEVRLSGMGLTNCKTQQKGDLIVEAVMHRPATLSESDRQAIASCSFE